MIYETLYAFIRAAQGMCKAAYCDPRLYTKEDHWGVLDPPPREFVDAIRTEGLDALLTRLEFGDVARGL